jgi:hypothetical protein
MGGQYGVKETKEALVALVALGSFVAARLKDGAQLDDALALGEKLMGDAGFKDKLAAGADGIDKVMVEVKELDLADFLDLAKVLPDLLAEVKSV